MAKQTIKSEDWDNLLPGSTHTIGTTELIIKPLGLYDLSIQIKKITAIQNELDENKITGENFRQTDKFFKLAEIIVSKVPDLISDAANLEVDDVQKLPLEEIVSLLEKLLDVNLTAKEALSKNLDSLGTKIAVLIATGVSAISPNSSSPRGIDGKKSKRTT